MAVSIVPRFTKADIIRMLAAKRQRIETAVLLRLQRVGEQFVVNARSTNTYKDRTGNLRSSIGYVVIKNGVQVNENLSGSSTGKSKARKVIDEIRNKYPSGWVIIGVAGMEYAAAVESKGYDVITSSSLQAETNLKESIRELQNKLK